MKTELKMQLPTTFNFHQTTMIYHKCFTFLKSNQAFSVSGRMMLRGVRHLYLSHSWRSDKFASSKFDPKLLEILACPLSKKPLRYDETNNELVCDAVGVAYPIVDGIPNLNPTDGRLLREVPKDSSSPKS